MYLDTESYAEYITAYKTFMFEVARVLVRELGSSVSDDQIQTQLEQAFEFERKIATVSIYRLKRGLSNYLLDNDA